MQNLEIEEDNKLLRSKINNFDEEKKEILKKFYKIIKNLKNIKDEYEN